MKSKYGKKSEVINAHAQSIIALPVVKGTNPSKIHNFYNKLLPSVQALESLGKLNEISGYTRLTLDKLEGIRADLVRLDDLWQEWGFPKLVEALSKWTKRNPLTQTEGRTGFSLQTRQIIIKGSVFIVKVLATSQPSVRKLQSCMKGGKF